MVTSRQLNLTIPAADIVFPDVCDSWGNPDLGRSFLTPVKSNIPVLLISGTLDGRTPVSSAEEVRKAFATASTLLSKGRGTAIFVPFVPED
jgi:hypothetical protein